MLALDVEFLLGVCFASQGQGNPTPDWPPQIDRMFSALVATWGARGERSAERSALEWLEAQPTPLIKASKAADRTTPTVFVPPNDASSTQLQALPQRRSRKERHFPATIPESPTLTYQWSSAPSPETLLALQALAVDTAYVGHSSSVVRCFFRQCQDEIDDSLIASKRRIYPDRLSELQAAFDEGRRPSPGAREYNGATTTPSSPSSIFGSEWHVFADAGGVCPDLRDMAITARAIRTAIMSGFNGQPVPEAISGHTNDGRPISLPHMAIFPMANLGWNWSDGRVMGIAVCLPREPARTDELALFQALGEMMRKRGLAEALEIAVNIPGLGEWRLARQSEPSGSSLQPERYCRQSAVWASALPIALDKHPKAKGNEEIQAEIAGNIADACERIGLPRPALVIPDKHSAIRGAVSAYPSGRSPTWMRWTLPDMLKGRLLTHATVIFKKPIRGPVALGAGRFIGLGLCLPLDPQQ